MNSELLFLIFIIEIIVFPLLLFILYKMYTNFHMNRNRIIVDTIIREINRVNNTENLSECSEPELDESV
jgi:hypothetical protein